MQPKPTHCLAPEGCNRPVYGRELCNMHWQRARKGKLAFPLPSPFLPRTATPEERFWRFVDKTDTCWLWTGAVDKNNGYARFGNGLAQRFIYEITVGPIADGGEIDHLCRVRNCVNPDHLELVTRQENHARQLHHGPPRKELCGRGHDDWHELPSGKRHCRTCVRENTRAYRARRKT